MVGTKGGALIFVGKSFKVESLTKTFASSIVVCEDEFQLCHKALFVNLCINHELLDLDKR
jgi:hypothetical protein